MADLISTKCSCETKAMSIHATQYLGESPSISSSHHVNWVTPCNKVYISLKPCYKTLMYKTKQLVSARKCMINAFLFCTTVQAVAVTYEFGLFF